MKSVVVVIVGFGLVRLASAVVQDVWRVRVRSSRERLSSSFDAMLCGFVKNGKFGLCCECDAS